MKSLIEILSEYETRKVVMECRVHGKVESVVSYIGGSWTTPKCSRCISEKEKARRAEKAAREAEEKMKRLALSSGIPRRYRSAGFEEYITHGKQDRERAKRIAVSFAERFDEVSEKGVSLIFTGNPGTGKTHLACAIANKVMKGGRTVSLTGVPAMMRAVRETYRDDPRNTESEVIASLANVDLLIIDEVGVQAGSNHELRVMFDILNERYQDVKPTILISNLPESHLEDYIGTPALDRFHENGGAIVSFCWESFRREKK